MVNFRHNTSPTVLLRLFFTLVCSLGAYWLVGLIALSAIGAVYVDIQSDQTTETRLYYSGSSHNTHFTEKRVSQSLPLKAGALRQLRFKFNNALIGILRIDPGEKPGVYRIYQVTPLSFFGETAPIIPHKPDLKLLAGPGTTLIKHDDFLEVRANSNDPWFAIVEPIKTNGYIYSLFAALLTFLATISIQWRSPRTFVFWQDTLNKKPSFGRNYAALDGLRGVAALFVLATHVGLPGLSHTGPIGVVIFFTLSGFLLSIPFANKPEKVISLSYMQSFFIRRFKRIVPMYYTLIVASYLFHDRLEDFLRSAFFLQGHGILWAVSQEVHFYLLFPLILLVNYFCFRNSKVLLVLWLFILGACFNHKILHTYTIYGQGSHMHIFAGLFISGILTGYLLQIDEVRNAKLLHFICRNPLIGILTLAAMIWIHYTFMLGGNPLPRMSWVYYGDFNYIIVFLIICLTVVERSLLVSIFAWLPLRLLGTVSFSFYLLHPICLKIVKQLAELIFQHTLHSTTAFISTFIFTFIMSIFTYTYIERTFTSPVSAK